MFKRCEPHEQWWDSPRLTYSAIADNPEGGQAGKGAVVGVMGGVGVVGAVRVVGAVGVVGKSPRILEKLKKSQKCKLQTCAVVGMNNSKCS